MILMKQKDALLILNKDFSHTVKDPLWQNIPFTRELKEILDVEDVQKLNRIRQNGPAYLVYPGAVHTRLNHSLGVYFLARQILISLSKSEDELPFSEKGIFSFLSACLLHDIGHFPYAHSLKELPLTEHEELAGQIILQNRKLYDAIKNAKAEPEMVASIIDKKSETSDEETLIYRNILSGTLDPDKLDYLTRDGFFAGLNYGKQDEDYIISSMRLIDGKLVLKEEALGNVEHILFSKYMMYKTLYWHKGVRSATSMIKKAIIKALKEKTIKYNELYFLDDNEFNNLCKERRIKTEALVLVDCVDKGKLLERKFEKVYEENGKAELKLKNLFSRDETENMVFELLKPDYPSLKEYEVIIDIPEPINFESSISILDKNGNVREIQDEDIIFSKKVSKEFQNRLRNVALFLPSYVSEKKAEDAFRRALDE